MLFGGPLAKLALSADRLHVEAPLRGVTIENSDQLRLWFVRSLFGWGMLVTGDERYRGLIVWVHKRAPVVDAQRAGWAVES